ncbi:MAG: hypothetical protein ACREVG_05405 [Burkholderiales bacterium]
MQKRLICPSRRRRVPTQFSWIDHRLVRDHHVERCSLEALALYLFLVTVADADGLSYYGDDQLATRLSLDSSRLRQARDNLIAADLVAFQAPLYQVLSLEGGEPR